MSLFQTQTLYTLKRITLILIAFLVTAAIVAYIWLWQYNNKISHPLPIQDQSLPLSGDVQDGSLGSDSVQMSQLHMVATPVLEKPLSQALTVFNARFPTIQTHITYLPASDISAFVQGHSEVGLVLADEQTLQNFQAQTRPETSQPNEVERSAFAIALATDATDADLADVPEAELQALPKLKGFILPAVADDSSVISLRNFLLASATQRYFNTDDTVSIEPYQNRVDDLFNPKGNPPADTPAEKLSIINAIDSERERENEAVELVE